MIDICTVADSKYLAQGLVLFESIKNKTSIPFNFHFLCINEEDYKKYNDKIDGVKFYNVKEFIQKSNILETIFDTDYKYFCWSLASFFSYYLLEYQKCPSIFYIDSDICFYRDIQYLLDKFGNKDCAIFRHRQFGLTTNRAEGLYNVGVVYFKNNNNGIKASSWWVDAVLNKKYPSLATCGDQKYLEYFPQLIGEENIYLDGDVGHGAPWLWQLYDLNNINEGFITWNGNKQDYYFTHFSQFKYSLTNNTFIHSAMHECYTNNNKIFENKQLNKHYQSYFDFIMDTYSKYNI